MTLPAIDNNHTQDALFLPAYPVYPHFDRSTVEKFNLFYKFDFDVYFF